MSKVIESMEKSIGLNAMSTAPKPYMDMVTLRQRAVLFHLKRRTLRLLLSTATIILPILTTDAAAIPITVTDPFKTLSDSIFSCSYSGHSYDDCTSTAFINSTSLTGASTEFRKSFDAWNSTNDTYSKWTLYDGGNLPGRTFDVSLFAANTEFSKGGLDITINWTYGGDTGIEHPPRAASIAASTNKQDYYWTQGLYLNFDVFGFTPSNYYMMDARANGDYKPPLYPNQYDDRHFYDGPRGPWPGAFFKAETFLSHPDFNVRTLTIYEGVRYGFNLTAVPEPSVFLLLASGLLPLWFKMLRRDGGVMIYLNRYRCSQLFKPNRYDSVQAYNAAVNEPKEERMKCITRALPQIRLLIGRIARQLNSTAQAVSTLR